MDFGETDCIIISEKEAGERLDKILADRFSTSHSRTYFQFLIDEKRILLNGVPVKKRIKPKAGDEVEIQFLITPELKLNPEPIPLSILYEDEDILAINKPEGMVVHPAAGNWTGTFVNALIHHCRHLAGGTDLRPGIVHRLDKDTTGVLLAAKNGVMQQRLIELFASRQIYKEYLAICVGNPGDHQIEAPIGRHPVHRKKMAVLEEGGKEAVTRCCTLAYDGALSLVHLVIATGRTHQIRVHMKHHGTPILGDPIYGSLSANKKYGVNRQMLHAHILRFSHPRTSETLEIRAPLPTDIKTFISTRSV